MSLEDLKHRTWQNEKQRDQVWAKAFRSKVTVVLHWGNERWEAKGAMHTNIRTAFPPRYPELTTALLIDWDFRLVPGDQRV